MTTIKEVIEIALNNGFLKPRYTIKELIFNSDSIKVFYYDNFSFDEDFVFECEFSF